MYNLGSNWKLALHLLKPKSILLLHSFPFYQIPHLKKKKEHFNIREERLYRKAELWKLSYSVPLNLNLKTFENFLQLIRRKNSSDSGAGPAQQWTRKRPGVRRQSCPSECWCFGWGCVRHLHSSRGKEMSKSQDFPSPSSLRLCYCLKIKIIGDS